MKSEFKKAGTLQLKGIRRIDGELVCERRGSWWQQTVDILWRSMWILWMTSSLSSHSTSASVSELSGLVTHTAVSSPKCNSEKRPLSNSVAFQTLFKWHRYCGILKINIVRKINTGIRYEPVYRPALLETSRTSARAYRSVKLIFSILRPAKAYPTTLPVDCKAFRPLNFTLPSKTCPLGKPKYPDGHRREHSRPGNLLFSSPRSSRLTVRHGDPETSRTRASQLDNLTFSSPTLGEAYPSDMAINKTTVRRWQEPPS